MSGKLVGGLIVVIALLFGAALWWAQVHAYYRPVAADDPEAVMRLVSLATGAPEAILADDFRGIDAASSPIRFRACFTTPTSLATLTETYRVVDDAVPLVGPGWFSCYDARTIGAALEKGEAVAFLSEPDIHPGVDRIVAVFADGRAYAWQQVQAGTAAD